MFRGPVEVNWQHLIERRPISLQINPELPSYLSLPEVHQLLNVARTPKDHLLVRLLWQTGARISEVISITVGQLTLTDEWSSGVLLDRLKQRGRQKKLQRDVIRKRWVPITDMSLVRELRRYINGAELKPGDRLLPHTRQWGYKRISLLSEKAKLPISVHPHMLRHSFACNAVLHGEPLTVIRDWLGHASLEQTEIYTRVLATETNHLMRYMSF
ncbi:tyrosine-type recombinase/integrase [Allohahella marinimesophila]|uniref:Tyrosine-type recombinase/integrase n=1 Tax=Allohahella marinimesophila TaxID=1054972 RepID=A0ABP7PTI0_9GAMM